MSGKPASEEPASPVEHSVHNPDDVIIELGGCGRFQIRIAILVHVIKTVCCWSTISIAFITAAPRWRCKDDTSANITHEDSIFDKACFTANGSKCSSFEFDSNMNTIVSEWGLVCDKDWIPTTWATIYLCVNILGYISAGHLADTFGRKVPFFLSIFIMMVFNLVSYFSVSWVMFAIVRLFVGIGTTFFLTIQYSYLSEFMLSRWRSWFIGFPSWPIQGCIMALVLWLLKDWRNFHLANASLCLPFLAAWWFMPESFRWYYSHDRVEDAERVVTLVSKINRRPLPDMTYMKQAAVSNSKSSDKKYSLLDLFSSRSLIKVTALMVIVWFAIGIIEAGILFGIQNLAGNFYLNIFLFRVVQIPSKSLGIWLQNRFGRRNTTILVYVVTGISTLLVGIVQYIDTDKRNGLTIGFALVANLAMEAAWGPLQTMTVELYPTVIRNIGFSFCAIIAMVGAAVGPQLVHLEISIPGIMYFTCGGLAVIGCCALLGLPETNNENLVDKLKIWGLVCDKDWIPTTWTTISLCVNILGYIFAGHLADMFGRKVPFFLSIFIMMAFNLVTYFSVSWVMFAIVRMFVGIGASFFLTIQYSYLSEFMLSRWRSWFIGFPSWPMQGCIMVLILWLLKDWRYFHLATAVLCLPFLAAWWFMPESFRWYYSHDRVEDAERVVTVVAKINRRPLPDMAYMKQAASSSSMSSDKKYSLLDLFSSRSLIKVTVLMVIVWFAIGIIETGIIFGVQNLAGNIYLNIFLFRVVEIPSKSLGIWLQNRFGRRITTMLVYAVAGISTLLVGIVQYIDTDKRNGLTIGFALVADLAIAAAWGPLQTMTVELYPTVIRNIGFSFCAIIAHVGAAVGPQLVHLETSIPGLMYFTCAGLAVIGCCALLGLPETNNENLVDKLKIVSIPSHTSHFDMNSSSKDMEIGIPDSKKDKEVNISDQNIENSILNSKVDKHVRQIKTISKGI